MMNIEKKLLSFLIGAAAIAGGSVLVINGLCKKTHKESRSCRGGRAKNLMALSEKIGLGATKKSLSRRTTVKDAHDKYANQ